MDVPVKTTELVWIEWWDACAGRHPTSSLAKADLARMFNIGWIIHEDRKRIVLAHSLGDSDEYDTMRISKRQIIRRIPVRRSAKARRKP